jgi:hypothetical protein
VSLRPIARTYTVPSFLSLDPGHPPPSPPPAASPRRASPSAAAAPRRAAAHRLAPLARAVGEHPCLVVLLVRVPPPYSSRPRRVAACRLLRRRAARACVRARAASWVHPRRAMASQGRRPGLDFARPGAGSLGPPVGAQER